MCGYRHVYIHFPIYIYTHLVYRQYNTISLQLPSSQTVIFYRLESISHPDRSNCPTLQVSYVAKAVCHAATVGSEARWGEPGLRRSLGEKIQWNIRNLTCNKCWNMGFDPETQLEQLSMGFTKDRSWKLDSLPFREATELTWRKKTR